MEEKVLHMEKKLGETHDMVKELYNIMIGTEDYKEAALLTRFRQMEGDIDTLQKDKIVRDATIKLFIIASSVVGTGVGSLLVIVLNYFFKK